MGEICEENGGLLAMTGSAFLDDGSSDGRQISGLAVCSGIEMGGRLGRQGISVWSFERMTGCILWILRTI